MDRRGNQQEGEGEAGRPAAITRAIASTHTARRGAREEDDTYSVASGGKW